MAGRLIIALSLFVFFFNHHAAAQKMVQKQRVVSIWDRTYYKDSVSRTDSLIFYYSGTRGSVFNPMDYWAGWRHYGYNISFDPKSIIVQHVSTAFTEHEPIAAQYDSVYDYDRSIYTSQNASKAVLNERYYASYDNNNEPSVLLQKLTNMPYERYTIGREIKTMPSAIKYETFDASRNSWQEKLRVYVWYGNGLLPVTDTSYHYWPMQQTYDMASAYLYDNAGRITTESYYERSWNSWEDDEQYMYSYDNLGKVTKRMFRLRGNAYDAEYISYNEAGKMSQLVSASTTNPDEKYFEKVLTYDANGDVNLITIVQYNIPGGPIEIKNEIKLYNNSYHNPDSITMDVYNNGILMPGHYRTYYKYEVYQGYETAIPEKGIIIYPNPAQRSFNIRWQEANPSQPVYVNIYSNTGQLVSSRYLASPGIIDAISVAGLTASVYTLKIVTGSGETLHTSRLVVD